ncbi:sel1 repeat family protein [Myxococcota bacterium]|nr:sel1 repeat family protein [Myxococcota bacterium]
MITDPSHKPRPMGCFLRSMLGFGALLILMVLFPLLMSVVERYRFQDCPLRDADICAAWQRCHHASTPPKQIGAACWRAGSAFHRVGTADALQQALVHYHKACERDIPQSCNNMGYLLESHIRAPSSYPFKQTAFSSFQRACHLQDPQGCNNLATFYEQRASKQPKHRQEHHKHAEASYQKACSLRNAQACRNLALLRERLRPSARWLIQQAYQEACTLGDSGGCRNLGIFYEQDHSDAARCSKANTYYQRACKLGDRSLCRYRCTPSTPRQREDEP